MASYPLFLEASRGAPTDQDPSTVVTEVEQRIGSVIAHLLQTREKLAEALRAMPEQQHPLQAIQQEWDADIRELKTVQVALQTLSVERPLVIAFHLPESAFGRADWARSFKVDIGEEPPFPPYMKALLLRPCSIWRGQLVQETFRPVLIPATVNGKPLTLRTLGELMQLLYFPKSENGYKNGCGWGSVAGGDTPIARSYWVMMSRELIPGSEKESYSAQQIRVTTLGKNYHIPRLLEAVVCIFAEYARSGRQLFSEPTYTRCEEAILNYPVIVGGFSSNGLDIDLNRNPSDGGTYGAACVLRQFY